MECIIQNGALVKCILDHGETTVILPEGIHAIGRRAFYNNQQLVSVEIPDSVKHIGIAVLRIADI